MKKRITILVSMVLLLFLAGFVYAAENLTNVEKDLNGREIMLKVESRDEGETGRYKLKMTLINRADDQRVRSLIVYRKEFEDNSRSLMFFKAPADVEGTAYLSWEFDDPSMDDSRWLYMPALRKVRRISGSSDDDYFMGTDFTYDDLGERNVDEDKHTLLREEELKDEICWVIQSIPVEESDYTEKLVWVRQDISMVVKIEFYNEYGLLKVFEVDSIEKIDGIWTERKMAMDNLQEEHRTILEFSDIEYNIPLEDKTFRTSTMERGILE